MKTLPTLLILMASLVIAPTSVLAVDEADVPESKRTKAGLYVTSKETYELVEKQSDQVLFLDVRTPEEVLFVGAPTVIDANVPLMTIAQPYQWVEDMGGYKKQINDDFIAQVQAKLKAKGLTEKDKVLLMCRSGGRSSMAADRLTQAGFSNVYSVIDGFEGDSAKDGENKGKRVVNGWKNSKLPWGYQVTGQQMPYTR